MPKIAYISREFRGKSLQMIDDANSIIDSYREQGLTLTLRQLYYQFVSRDLLPNKQENYKKLGSIINDARLAGLIDWEAIEDRTRNLSKNSHWDSPGDAIDSVAYWYKIDNWEGQEWQPEVWIEKEALAGVLEGPCGKLDVPFFACRGYTSQSEMWSASQRLMRYKSSFGRKPVIIHLGDHDPSGIDMTRDIVDRMNIFFDGHGKSRPEVVRIALNMDQIEVFNPPPNPAKKTDSRFLSYEEKFGGESWELDALEPRVLVDLITKTVKKYRDDDIYNKRVKHQEKEREGLRVAASRWEDIQNFLKK